MTSALLDMPRSRVGRQLQTPEPGPATTTQPSSVQTPLGNFIRSHRLKLRLTQAGVGEAVGLSTAQVSRIECGISPTTHGLTEQFADVLEVRPEYLASYERRHGTARALRGVIAVQLLSLPREATREDVARMALNEIQQAYPDLLALSICLSSMIDENLQDGVLRFYMFKRGKRQIPDKIIPTLSVIEAGAITKDNSLLVDSHQPDVARLEMGEYLEWWRRRDGTILTRFDVGCWTQHDHHVTCISESNGNVVIDYQLAGHVDDGDKGFVVLAGLLNRYLTLTDPERRRRFPDGDLDQRVTDIEKLLAQRPAEDQP